MDFKGIYVFIFFTLIVNISRAQPPKLVLPVGHTKGVHAAIFSPDGKTIVTSSSDGSAKMWDASNGMLLYDSLAQSAQVKFFEFSPNSALLFSVYENTIAKILDAKDGKVLFALGEGTTNLMTSRFSPDSKKLLTISTDSIPEIWDIQTRKPGPKLKLIQQDIFTVDFSDDGKKVLGLSNSGSIKIWDAQTGELLKELTIPLQRFYSAKFIDEDKKIFSSTYSGKAIVWDLSSSQAIIDLSSYAKEGCRSAISENGEKVITVSKVYGTKIWDVKTFNPLFELNGFVSDIHNIRFSRDSKKLMAYSKNGIIQIWDVSKGIKLFEQDKNEDAVTAFSPNSTMIAISKYTFGGTTKVLDVNTGSILYELAGKTKIVSSVVVSKDGQRLLIASWDGSAKIWGASSAKLISNLSGNGRPVVYANFSPDEKEVFTGALDSCKIWQTENGKFISHLDAYGLWISSAEFSPDKKKLITTTSTNFQVSTNVWDTKTGKLVTDLTGAFPYYQYAKFDSKGNIVYADAGSLQMDTRKLAKGFLQRYINAGGDIIRTSVISPDKKRVVLVSRYISPQITVWDTETGDLIKTIFLGDNALFEDVNFNKNIVITSENSMIVLFDLLSGNKIYSFITLGSEDYFSIIPSGYYSCSRDGAKSLHYVTKDLKIITFEQLDVKYNRPDKVLEAIGNTDTTLIKSYRKAWEKRIKKLGIDTTSFRDGYSVPEADFANRDNIEYEQKTGTLKLHIKGIDSTYKLDRFNVWVNEAPVYGQRGIYIRKRNKNDFDTTITIKLSQGKNRIETSISNVNGTESYRMPLIVNYTPTVKQKETTHFIGIGIDQFADNNNNLQYCTKDIRDLAFALKVKYKDNIIIDTLFNENVTVSNVKALKKKLLQTTENDKVIVSYSGHGVLSKELDYYLSTYSVNFSKPEENGLAYDELEDILDSIPARKKLMFIDACHSGEIDKDELEAINKTADSIGLKKDKRGIKPIRNKTVGLNNSFELMQSLFVNVGKSTGATIISAAGGTQFALERNGNGVFTNSILEAIKQYPTLKISELKKIVGERVEQLTNGLQKPTSRNETIAVDWSIW